MPKYEFDTVRWLRNVAEVQSHRAGAGAAMTRENMLKCAEEIERLRAENDTLRNEARVYRKQCDMANGWRDKIEAELAALKEAARPVVGWYTRSKRHFPDEFRPRDIALEYDGPHGRIKVACLELDALAALVGEDG